MPRSRIKDQRKQQLIQATMDSIAKRGLTETTITHISKGASLSRGIINFYFDSKEKMMREVLGYLLEEYQAAWQQAQAKADNTKPAQLEAMIRAHFDRKICSAKRLNVLSAFWGHAASHEAYRVQFDACDAAILAAINDAAPDNALPSFANQLYALIRGCWLRFLLAPKQTERDTLAEEVLAFVNSQQATLKVVASNQNIQKPRKSASRKSEAQMDIEDLFANG